MADGGSIGLPVNVLRGRQARPRLVAIAGVHGDEHDGPASLLDASEGLDPNGLQGTLVIVPIALRLIVPPATSESLNLLKNSSVALTISVAELTFQTRQIETYTAKAIEALTAGTVIYLVLCVGIAAIMARVERRFAIPGLIARGG